MVLLKKFRNIHDYPHEEYAFLWHNAMISSPFSSPSSLSVLWKFFEQANIKIEVWHFYDPGSGQILAAMPLRKENGVYRLLFEGFGDYHHLLVCKALDDQAINDIFQHIVLTVKRKKMRLFLKNVPRFSYLNQPIENSPKGLFFGVIEFKHSVFPVLKKEDPQAIFTAINTKKMRYYRRRLEKAGALFETFHDDAGLDSWADGFVDNHIARWKGTDTPSKFLDKQNIVLFKQRLSAWHQDNVVIRFSAKLNGEYMAFCVGLIEEKRLIYHLITHDPKLNKYSPGKALIHYIGEYISSSRFTALDFGEGDEPYKLSFCNESLHVSKLYISSLSNAVFLGKAFLKKNHFSQKSFKNMKQLFFLNRCKKCKGDDNE